MIGIPTKFNNDNVLDPGTYKATFGQLRSSLLVVGDGTSTTWDSAWRLKLIDNLEVLANQLWSVGYREVFLDGSFVENKDRPNDIDGYFDAKITSINPIVMQDFQRNISTLNSLDPHCCWTWEASSRKFDQATGKGQLPMWHFYRIELYPHIEGMFSGITDKQGNNLKFPSAFRQSRRNYIPKGIVELIP